MGKRTDSGAKRGRRRSVGVAYARGMIADLRRHARRGHAWAAESVEKWLALYPELRSELPELRELAAKAEAATYRVSTGIVEMTGNVLLTQGPNAVSGQSMRIDLNAGTGLIEGRVQTIFTPGSAPGGAAPRAAPGASR